MNSQKETNPMLNRILSIFAIAISLGALAWNFFKSSPRVAYAENAVLMTEFSEAVSARKSFEGSQKEWDKNLKALNDSLTAHMEVMKRDYDGASKAAKDSLRFRLQKRNDDLQRYTEAVKQMAVEKEKELMDPVIRKLNAYLDQWGREHRYDLVLGTMTGGNILQANPRLNVTAQVLKDLNDHYRALPANPAKDSLDGKVSRATLESGKK